jgi:hypothetical protein
MNGKSACLVLTLVVACESQGGAPSESKQLQVLAPGESYAGKSAEEWAVEYQRWSFSQTSCEDSPIEDRTGAKCADYQASDSPVFFLEHSSYSGANAPRLERKSCHVPFGKAILVPVALVAIDNAGALEPVLDSELEADAGEVKETMAEMTLLADHTKIEDLALRGVGPLAFDYQVPPAPNFYTCTPGYAPLEDMTVSPSFLAGYIAIFAPPPAGVHELEYASAFKYLGGRFAFHVDATFTVDP